ncbi:hypothetical protein Slin15195_G113800 [Septoria linicola]|uniref:Uncharacterized protein n=1 Tax=Septoria linicola TaxID=215465 RepID=A0A9Q9B7Z8_9PEZI|nr:hypothetical protein Slin15195_G113800 [Septoria linicola]
MPTTRSKTNGSSQQPVKPAPPASTTSTKRKAPSTEPVPAKKPKKEPTKQAKIEPETGELDTNIEDDDNADNDNQEETVTINRAPVLELWSACVTQTLYPSLAWNTCLSAGSAISTLAAISKGRAIGKIDKPDQTDQAAKQQKRREQESELEELDVMSFHLKLKDGEVMVGDKPKKGNEEALSKKYGGEEVYENVKKTMMDALDSWKGKEEELGKRGFHMYEDFRPSVAAGQKGWGRKGTLSLKTVRDTVAG